MHSDMQKLMMIALAGAGLVFAALTGSAHAYTINDTTQSRTYIGQSPGSCCRIPSWTDVIGSTGGRNRYGQWSDGFDVKGIDVAFGTNSLTLQIYTNMPQSGIGSSGARAVPGAIFLDPARTLSQTGAADNYTLAIKLNADAGGAAGLYDVSAYNLSRDKWGRSPLSGHYVYGGLFRNQACGSAGEGNCSGYDVPVSIKTGSLESGVDVSVNWRQIDDVTKYRIDVTLDNLAPGELQAFDLLWAAGDCGNDVIWGTVANNTPTQVPEPGTLGLFLVGLIGAGVVRRQRRRAA